MNPRDLIALTDAPAEYRYLTVRLLRYWVACRTIPSYRVGRRVYLDRVDLENLPTRIPAFSERYGRAA